MFTHLHVHSEYSLLDGLIKIDALLDEVKRQGMTSVALTDHGAMYGAFEFYLKAKDRGIKPIIGVEIYKAKKSRFDKQPGLDRDQYHLVLLAKNYQGYKNLMKIVTAAHLEGFYYKPRIDFSVLEKYREGLICLSGCLASEISQSLLHEEEQTAEDLLKRYLSIFDKDFYLELQRHQKPDSWEKVNKKIIQLSRKFGVPLVATNDVHYLNKDDAYAQEILLCIQSQQTIYEKNRSLSMIESPDYYFKNESEMRGLFIDLPEAIENTQKIVDQCHLEIPYGHWILPKFEIPTGETPEGYLRSQVFSKIGERFPRKEDQEKIIKRIEYELSVINKKGYATYFLIVADFVNWAKNHRIAVGPGRGSVAGSLVAYILKITDINPLDYNLPFERFLNPDRPTPPDIDIDFADVRRDQVLNYVIQKYGKEKVAQIITFGRMEARLSVRDVARALGMSYSAGDRIAKMIPMGKQGFPMTIDKALEESPQLKFAYNTEEETKRVLDIARKIEGLARHSSVHAAGVVIGDRDLTEYVPLQKEAKGERIITQYDMYCLDLNAVSDNKAVGLLKVDFLGLRNLTILENAISYVYQNSGKKIDIHNVPLDDKKTFDLISRGQTVGVFQLESYGMRQLAKELKPTRISDIMAMVALYRPGPMDLIPSFLEGKKNIKKIKYLHKDLIPILSETYGILVYQEQVMEIAHRMAGYTMAQADTLRMAMGKKKKSLMKKEKENFINGCVKKGYSKALAEKIFSFIEKFAGYGFNKPHSASYALIAYWTAYMKANYPVEYMTALLSAELQGASGPTREAKIFQTVEECRAMEIPVYPPEINQSDADFKIENGGIRFGLSAVKNVGEAAIESILNGRRSGPFVGLKDFLMRVDLRKVNKKTVESLVKAGVFDQFGSRASLLAYYPKALEEVIKEKNQSLNGQFGLFGGVSEKKVFYDQLPEVEDFSDNEKVIMEKEILGFSLSHNPLDPYKNLISKKITKKIGEINDEDTGKNHILAGAISRVKKITTKKNNHEMAFVTVYDETGTIEIIVFPKVYAENKSIWMAGTPILFKGKIDSKEGRLNVLVDQVVDLRKVKND